MGYEDPVQLADLLHRLTRRLRRAQAERLAPLGLEPDPLPSIHRPPSPGRPFAAITDL